VTGKHGLAFARPIPVGLDSLSSALTRPLRVAGGGSVELNRDAARAILYDWGFPSRTQVVQAESGLTGAHIIPVMQPVLQRFMIELRQSLRFALPEAQRQDLTLKLTGPGGRTPGFAHIVADELSVKVDPDDASREYDYRDVTSPASELMDALLCKRAGELALEPAAISRVRRARHLQRWLWTGTAAAAAMIAMDVVRFESRLAGMRRQAQARQTQDEGMAALKLTADRLLATSSAMGVLEGTIRKEIGAPVRIGAVLHELSRLTPPAIRLINVSFKPGSEGTVLGGVSGYAMEDPHHPGAASQLLQEYMERLTQSPLMSRLTLANVQSTLLEQAPAQTFDMSFEAIGAPVEASMTAPSRGSSFAAAAGAGKEQQP